MKGHNDLAKMFRTVFSNRALPNFLHYSQTPITKQKQKPKEKKHCKSKQVRFSYTAEPKDFAGSHRKTLAREQVVTDREADMGQEQ